MKHEFQSGIVILVSMFLTYAAWPQQTVIVAVPARAGAVEGITENSDAFMWRILTNITSTVGNDTGSKVAFETWATDNDTFTPNPHWPEVGEPMKLHKSVLETMKAVGAADAKMQMDLRANTIDVDCGVPVGAAVGGFPTSGSPPPCIAEQVERNRPLFDYIVTNKLYTQTGLETAYEKSMDIDMPLKSVAVKGDWVPLGALLQWIPQLKTIDNIRKQYHTTVAQGVEYALVSLHMASRQNKNWVWATFEHELNPGRCDYIGCFDSFGAQKPAVGANKVAFNTQYGVCQKTLRLESLMKKASLSPVWRHYCLKSSQVDFTAADGTPYVLGNSVIEGIVGNGTVAASSCISCHYYASFGPTGATTPRAKAILPFNPTGNPIPGVLAGSRQFSFMWGILLAPK